MTSYHRVQFLFLTIVLIGCVNGKGVKNPKIFRTSFKYGPLSDTLDGILNTTVPGCRYMYSAYPPVRWGHSVEAAWPY